MRLLYVTDALAIYGGIERVLTQKVNWLAEHGYEVCVLTVNQGKEPLCFPLHSSVQYDDLNILFYQQYRFVGWNRWLKKHQLNCLFRHRLSERIKVFSPDIIICTSLEYVYSLLLVKGLIPLVFESHSSCLCESFEHDGICRRLYMRYMKHFVKQTAMVVALTEGDAAEWRKYSSHVCVIPNVVSLNPSNVISDCSAKSAIFVGRFSGQKDIGSLLRIWSVVHEQYPDWKLHIYGGYGVEKVKRITEINSSGTNIVVHEPSAEIIERYKENSIFLLTSKYEPFGLVLPEAMSCGLPVVAFDCPYGPADIITDGVDGFLVKGRDCRSFAEKVCMLIDDMALRKKMGESGAQSARRFDTSVIMPVWDSLFKKILNHDRYS
ncbi:glycosyltransferase [Prevotella sp. P6B4]|uniref:glycosyltransferase n=1 Tax=Prevotella sp. P6B4 TaxID=1410614 RepID=UPI00048ED445|nr:glycosyltransferase [Prevotella sp. P6B4]